MAWKGEIQSNTEWRLPPARHTTCEVFDWGNIAFVNKPQTPEQIAMVQLIHEVSVNKQEIEELQEIVRWKTENF
ncbi:MAG: hypothetical protein C4K58_06965 [Flavobacteriaceae bacterium]|nr:MAG: hypothetical protein C4K58_06965 [Flavobacteriaceae bacterium]